MNISIRDYIKDNFKNSDEKEIRDSIESSLKENAEETLPGMGVFFEMVWQNSKEEERKNIIQYIKKGVNNN